jgi:FlaA1/EpsC-like NDP-sugar epimerase
LKQFDRGLRTAVLSLDVLISATAFVAVIALMVQDDSAALTRAGSVKLIVLGLVTSLVWPVTLQSTVAARATRQVRVSSLFALLFLAGSLSAVVVAATAFALRAPIPPMTLLACVLAQLASVSAFRISILGFLRLARRRGRNVRNLLIAGSGPRAREVHRTVERHPEWG